MNIVGRSILKIINEWGMSQKQLAVKLGTNESTVSSWINGSRKPDSRSLEKLCQVLNVTEAEIYGAPTPKEKELLGLLEGLPDDIIEALSDPVAIKALLITHKNKEDLKKAIIQLLEKVPDLNPAKINALISLCDM